MCDQQTTSVDFNIYELFKKNPVVTIDSRNVPEGALFFALKGSNFDGNDFANKALSNGASYAIVDNPEKNSDDKYVLVKDVLSSLQNISKIHRNKLNPYAIGITGSNGKTTTKELMHAVLKSKYNTIATQGNLNNHIGVPLSLLRANKKTQMLIIEMGANHIGEIETLCDIAKPTHGIITNIGKAHLEGFGSFEGVIKAKSQLYDYLKRDKNSFVFNNSDDLLINEILDKYNIKTVSYGSNNDADIKGTIINDSKTFLSVVWIHNKKKYTLNTKLVGTYNFYNVMAAIASGLHFGIDPEEINSAIENYTPQNNRSQFFNSGNNRVILDCYNANPTSMALAIDNFFKISVTKEKLLILGDMLELGDYAVNEHKKIVDMLTDKECEIITVGPIFKSLSNNTKMKSFDNVDELIDHIGEKGSISGQEVLVKGSRGIELKKIIKYL